MRPSISPLLKDIQISGIRQIADRIKQEPDVVALTIGEPDFQTPEMIKEAGRMAITSNQTFYAPNPGILELRQAAGSFLETRYGLSYRPEDEVIVTNGSTEALYLALRTVLEPGDEVVIPVPTYPGYAPVITLCGAKLVSVDTTATNFKLTKEQLRAHLTPKTKVVLLPYPSNPTGAILTREELTELVEVLENEKVFVLSDELYSELVFDQPHVSIASFPSMRDKTIVINGVSKSHAMTGWRIGFSFAPSYLTQEMLKVHQYVNTSVNTMAQTAATLALQQGQSDVARMQCEYQRRRDYLHSRLTTIGFSATLPEATFYLFPDMTAFRDNSYDFSMELIEKARVGFLPSTVFTEGGNHHFRLSFAYSLEKIEEAMNRVERYLYQ